MKKFLLSVAVALVSVFAANAQVTWSVGQEITNDESLGWGNLNFSSDPMDFWKWESSKGSTTTTGANLFEVYDGADCNLYQYVKLPAGLYRLECQAYYRCGNSWADDPSVFGTADWADNALLYAQTGTYDIDSETFIAGRKTTTPVMPRLFPMNPNKLYTMPEGEASWDMSDGSYTVGSETVYGPCSVPGSKVWFEQGYYGAYNQDGVVYNQVNFFVAKDGYVRVGISKEVAREADSFMATNFKLFYEGEVSADAELAALQDEVEQAKSKAKLLSEEILPLYAALASLMNDDIMTAEDDEDPTTVEGCNASIDAYNKITVDYTNYFAQAKELTALIAKCESLNEGVDDPTFAAAIAAAKAVESDGNDGGEASLEAPTAYGDALNALNEARAEFIKNVKSDDGSIDVTSYISYPWFCLPEYEPTWDKENNCWVPNEAALNTPYAEGSEETWSTKDDCNGTINNIAKGVNVYGKDTESGVWYQSNKGGSLEVYWNDNLTCIKKWSLVSEDFHDVSQRLSNIPNGYYKLKALAQTWSNDWANNCMNHIYIKSNAMESHSPYLEPGGWWGKNIDQWKELETDMILVDDNEVIISSRDNGFAAFTGFRLFYYGETPDFNKLLAADITAIKDANSTDNGLWTGDVLAINEIMAKIPADIASEAEFLTASETINEAKAYISTAQAAINTFNTQTLSKFGALQDTYENGDENEIAVVAQMGVISLGDEENNNTYKDALAATEDEAMYEKYLDFVVNKAKPVNNANLNAAIETQYAVLKAEYVNAAKLAEYLEILASPYNAGIIANLGAATLENPVDASVLIVNPKFEEGSKGYTGDMTIYSDPETKTTIVERWNTNSNIYQTIYALPAGTYQIKAQAFYRDGGNAGDSFNNWIYTAMEDVEYWETKSAILYANDKETYVRSIASEKITDQMTKYCEKMEEDEEWLGDVATYHPVYKEQPETDPNAYPWDTQVADYDDDFNETFFYYPNSVQGSASVWMRHPEAYWNTVTVYLAEEGNITFGIKEETNIGGDWVVMHQFKLLYLGAEAPTAIKSAAVANNAPAAIYSINGVQTRSLQKGINIVKMADGTVKKVIR